MEDTLHISEHIIRHTSDVTNESTEYGTGIENYFPASEMTPSELSEFASNTCSQWKDAMACLLQDEEKEIDMHGMYHLIEHTGYHLGQIVDRVQSTAGTSFSFCQNGLNERNLREAINVFINFSKKEEVSDDRRNDQRSNTHRDKSSN